jgi:hypothetical protein
VVVDLAKTSKLNQSQSIQGRRLGMNNYKLLILDGLGKTV